MSATIREAGNGAFDAMSPMNADAFKEGYAKFAKSMTSFADLQKGSMEAVMACMTVMARGMEKASAEQTAFAKETYEAGVAAAKAASTAKSVQEAMEINSDFMRVGVEKNLAFATRLSDHWTSVVKEASEPVSKRYGEFVEMVQAYRP